jgi:hypothetical protein
MPANEEMMREMDEAAELAENELDQNLENWSTTDIISWWSRWYMRTGHKRLGRALVARGKKHSSNKLEVPSYRIKYPAKRLAV